MKRYLTGCIVVLLVVLIINNNWQLKTHDQALEVVSYSNNGQLYLAADPKPFIIKGVRMDGHLPGDSYEQKQITKQHYIQWFQQIVDMNANTLQVADLMPKHFYDALYTFNQGREEPLYLIQGIGIDSDWLDSGIDVFAASFQKNFKKHIYKTIDAIHGAITPIKHIDFLEKYGKDISPYVLAYNIGTNWDEALSIYTDIMHTVPPYQGEYIKSTPKSTALETFIATFMDEALVYEQSEYNTQRLLTTTNFMSHEMLAGNYTNQYFNHYINLETLEQTDQVQSGLFVSYDAYPFKPEFLNHIPDYIQAKDEKGEPNSYRAILEAINKYHTLPVAISAYGIPSSRGIAYRDNARNFHAGGIDEQRQGEILGILFEDIIAAGLCGGSVNNWYDTWHRDTWNTGDSNGTDQNQNWGNVQSANTAFGLISLDTSLQTQGFYPDGSKAEWQKIKPHSQGEELQLAITQDEKYLYLLLEQPDIDLAKDTFYIGFDLTPHSGSTKYKALTFQRPVDFVLAINGKTDTSLQVHQYYATHTFASHIDELKQDPTEVFYEPTTDIFVPIELACRPKTYIDTQLVPGMSYETGKFTHGQANPAQEDFNSLADFYVAQDFIEIRIPWALLNFQNPSKRQIYQDYYQTFVMKPLEITKIHLELVHQEAGQTTQPSQSTTYNLNPWSKAKYQERLKPAYYQLQAIYSQY